MREVFERFNDIYSSFEDAYKPLKPLIEYLEKLNSTVNNYYKIKTMTIG